MAYNARQTFVIGLLVCIFPFLGLAGTAAGAQESQTGKVLQPQGLNYAGIYALRQMDPNLTGAGVKFAVICRSTTYTDGKPQNDYRPNISHNCLKSKQLRFNDQGQLPAGVSSHSTATCSILLGEDPNASGQQLGQFYYQGTAPQGQAEVYEFWHFLINNVFPQSPPDADVVTAGFGSQFEDWWTRGIESMAEHYGLVIVAGIGNGSNAHDSPLYPAAGSNVIGVGVVDSVKSENPAIELANFSLAHPAHSSTGPTADGRCKPDIVTAGNCLAADNNEPDSYEATGNWSSFSTPIVAGALGLLVQKAKQDPNLSPALSPQGGNCVMKAILLNSATKLPFWHKGLLQTDDDHSAPLDYVQGAGLLNATDAYKHLIAGPNKPGNINNIGWDNNQLDKNENLGNIYKITVTEPAGKVITATVVWKKHYDTVYPFAPQPQKDANLRLELWAIDPNNPNNDYLLDYSDSSTDNLEHIYTPADANYTNYEIIISYSNIDDPNLPEVTQPYGLAWSIGKKQAKESIFWYDLNADGIVNEADLDVLLDNLVISITKPESYSLGDINSNGVIDANDVLTLIDHINTKANWYTTK